ncbi:MAG TPA: ribosome maturation factor RimP [Coriobacteriia bacterium]|nr:ribosome maturation factor RimP [Coriobacteriia bacterium]
MAITDLAKELESLLEPIAEQHGFELVAVEQAGGRKQPVIRVLLDKEGGVNLDAICEANEWVSEAIDEADPLSSPYQLEVSSPGVDRPLRKRQDYDRFAGETVTLKAKPAGQNRSAWTGTLVGLEGDDVVLEVEDEQVKVPFESVQKARLKGVVSFNKERGAE